MVGVAVVHQYGIWRHDSTKCLADTGGFGFHTAELQVVGDKWIGVQAQLAKLNQVAGAAEPLELGRVGEPGVTGMQRAIRATDFDEPPIQCRHPGRPCTGRE